MDVFVARQPIFDRHMNVYGYELLYRRSMKNVYEGIDDNQATAEVINNAFLTMHFEELIEDTRAFINFPDKMLNEKTPLLLPKDQIVIEVLERVDITAELLYALEEMRDEGYIIALDDFIFHPDYFPLLDVADIVKIEFPEIDLHIQRKFIEKYKGKIKFIAEKVETREEYRMARKLGYDYFQGYFFSKPVVIKAKEISTFYVSHIQIIHELDQRTVDFEKIEEIIQRDVSLSYKLLKLVNTLYFETTRNIKSIKQALVRLGINEIRRWIYLLMIKDIETIENRELLKLSVIRAKFMELLANMMGEEDKKTEYFLTGLFSEIDALTNRPMEEVIGDLALMPDVNHALLGEKNQMGILLEHVVEFEKNGTWIPTSTEIKKGLNKQQIMPCYIEALSWSLKDIYS